MRCTEPTEMPTALAIARPVQWVAWCGGSVHVSATTCAVVSAASGALPGLRGLVAQQTLDPALGKALLPPPYRRPADADALRHPLRRMPIRRGILFTNQLHADLGVTHVTQPQQAASVASSVGEGAPRARR